MTILGVLLICCCVVIPFLKPDSKMHRKLLLLFCILIPFLAFCDLPIEQYKVEYDSFNKNFHGQVIKFKTPISYQIFEKKHVGDYPKTIVDIGQFIVRNSEITDNQNIYKKYTIEPIQGGMAFTVLSSFWLRKNFINSIFSDDIHYLVMSDEKGTYSVMSFHEFAQSDKPMLQKFE